MDSNEVWLEVTAFDAARPALVRSGGRAPRDGALDPDTHLVRAQPVDGDGRPLLRRDPQHMRGPAFDAALTPSDPQLVRYEVPRAARVEAGSSTASSCPPTRASPAPSPRRGRRRCLDLPVVELAPGARGRARPRRSRAAGRLGPRARRRRRRSRDEALPPLPRARPRADRIEPLLGLGRRPCASADRRGARPGRQPRGPAPDHPAPLCCARALLDAFRFGRPWPADRLVRGCRGSRGAGAAGAGPRPTHDAAGALAVAEGSWSSTPSRRRATTSGRRAGELGRAGESPPRSTATSAPAASRPTSRSATAGAACTRTRRRVRALPHAPPDRGRAAGPTLTRTRRRRPARTRPGARPGRRVFTCFATARPLPPRPRARSRPRTRGRRRAHAAAHVHPPGSYGTAGRSTHSATPPQGLSLLGRAGWAGWRG